MNRLRLPLAVLLALSGLSNAQAEIPLTQLGPFQVGLEGLLQTEANWFDEDRADLDADGAVGNDLESGVRRAEVALKGKAEALSWVVAYDFEGEKYLDVNLQWKLGGHKLLLGQYKQFNGLEELSSSKYNDFIAKAAATNLFAVSRRLGAGVSRDGGDWGYQFGLFSRELTANRAHGAGWAGRAYYAPTLGNNHWLHVGLSLVDQDSDADTLRLRVRPNADLAAIRLIDSGSLTNTDRQQALGLEAAWINGPIKLQGEYFRGSVDRYATGAPGAGADYDFNSGYLSGLWNLGGESWSNKAGVPTASLKGEGIGSFQLGLRYDSTDLDDGSVRGGQQDSWTAGVNWYWRSNFRLSANYVMVDSERFNRSAGRVLSDDPNILELRAQLYW